MKKFILAVFMALSFQAQVHAFDSNQMEMVCASTEQVLSVVRSAGETLYWYGMESNREVLVSIWVNQEIGTYTLMKTTGDRTCVMSFGVSDSIL